MTGPWERYQQQPAGPWSRYQQPAPPPKYESTGEWIGDLARTGAQGLTIGAGDEIIAGVRSVLPESLGGATYDDALTQERAAVERFRTHNPFTALGTEIAGGMALGLALPGLGGASWIARGGNAASKVARSATVGAGWGTAGGFASGEGGVGNRLESAASGAKWGAGLGGAVQALAPVASSIAGTATNTVQRGVQRVRDNEAAARLYFADRLRQAGTTEADIGRELQRGQAAANMPRHTVDLPETIADAHPIAQRILRGIKVGGDAEDIIGPQLSQRQAGDYNLARGESVGGQYERVLEDVRRALNVGKSTVAQDIDRAATKRSQIASQKFSRAWQESFQPSNAFDLGGILERYGLTAQTLTHPTQRAKLVEALRLFDPQGYQAADITDQVARRLSRFDERINRARLAGRDVTDMMARRAQLAEDLTRRANERLSSPGVQKRLSMGVNTLERFQRAKEALDDMLSSSAVRDQPNLKRLLTGLKRDLMDEVGGGAPGARTRNAAYFEALQDYASRSELMDAAEIGREIANGTRIVPQAEWSAMTRAQQSLARKAYLEQMTINTRSKTQGEMTDFTAAFRSPKAQDDLRMILPPRAGANEAFPGGNRERLAELIRRERRMTETNQKVMGNSTTAEKLIDAMDVSRLARVARYMRENGGPINAAVTALSEQIERFAAIKGQRARYLAQQLLTTDPQQQERFLQQITQQYGASRAAQVQQAVATVMDQATGPTAGALSRAAISEENRQ